MVDLFIFGMRSVLLAAALLCLAGMGLTLAGDRRGLFPDGHLDRFDIQASARRDDPVSIALGFVTWVTLKANLELLPLTSGSSALGAYGALTFGYFASAFSKPSFAHSSRILAAVGKTDPARVSPSSGEKSDRT